MAMAKLGIQTCNVQNHMREDPIGTFRELAAAGYRYVEVSNFDTEHDKGAGFHMPASELNKFLDDVGIRIISIMFDPFDHLDELCEYQCEIGNHNVVFSRDFYQNRDEVLRRAEWLNQTGATCAKHGIQFHYHNHFHEFMKLPGEEKTIWEMLLENTDPDLVKIEIDTFWAMRGGVDPAEEIRRLGKRVSMIHQKDYTKGHGHEIYLPARVIPGEEMCRAVYDRIENKDTFCEIGWGIMDIQRIIDAGNESGALEYFILEQDWTKLGEFESIRRCYQGMQQFHGIEL